MSNYSIYGSSGKYDTAYSLVEACGIARKAAAMHPDVEFSVENLYGEQVATYLILRGEKEFWVR